LGNVRRKGEEKMTPQEVFSDFIGNHPRFFKKKKEWFIENWHVVEAFERIALKLISMNREHYSAGYDFGEIEYEYKRKIYKFIVCGEDSALGLCLEIISYPLTYPEDEPTVAIMAMYKLEAGIRESFKTKTLSMPEAIGINIQHILSDLVGIRSHTLLSFNLSPYIL
jgi:hypothetical protein